MTTSASAMEKKTPMRKVYTFDMTKYNNDKVWKHIEDEEPDRKTQYSFTGVVVRITKYGVVLYVPITGVYKIFVENKFIDDSPFLKTNGSLILGQWMTVDAEKRAPKESDVIKRPKFSHLAVGKAKSFSMEEKIPNWQQRHFGGVFEFLLTADLSTKGNVVLERFSHNNKAVFVVKTEVTIDVLVPTYRLEKYLESNWTAKKRIRFWATRAEYRENISLHLLDWNNIEELLPNGDILDLGKGKHGKNDESFLQTLIPIQEVKPAPRPVVSSAVTIPSTTVTTPTASSGKTCIPAVDSGKGSSESSPTAAIGSMDTAESKNGAVSVTPTQSLNPSLPPPPDSKINPSSEKSVEKILRAVGMFEHPVVKDAIREAGLLDEYRHVVKWAENIAKNTNVDPSDKCSL